MNQNETKPLLTEASRNIPLGEKVYQAYSDINGLSLQNLFFAKNSFFPCCYMFTKDGRESDSHFDTHAILSKLIETTPEDENMKYIVYRVKDITSNPEFRRKEGDFLGFCVALYKSNIFARIEESVGESYVLYDLEHEKEALDFIDTLRSCYVKPKKEEDECNVYILKQTQAGYGLAPMRINSPENFDIDKQYNDDFKKEDAKINKFIDDEKKAGLVILHGVKGSGKTTYIRHLIEAHPDKKFVTIPPSMLTIFSDPSFATYLPSLTGHIIILEDCENVIRSRKVSGNVNAVSTLLNVTDGLYGDEYCLKFICTFNEDIRNIDEALTRPGRLQSMYEFKELSVEKATALVKELYENAFPPTKPLTLAEIYNYMDDRYVKERTAFI